MRKWLISLREEMHLTQNEMSKKLDCSQSYYAQIESTKRMKDLSLAFMQKVSTTCNVALEQISEWEAQR